MHPTASYKIFSFYNSHINPEVARYQEAVFRHFGYVVHYVVDDHISHGDFLNQVCRTVTDTDYLIFFDVDCIPVKQDWLGQLLDDLRKPRTLAGAAQTANHLREGRNLYVSPFFFGVSTAFLKELGYPDLAPTANRDAGQHLTEVALQQGGQVIYWWPTDIEQEQWSLYHPVHTKFGPGTTYNGSVYHAFQSRLDVSGRFLRKCRSLLPFTTRLQLRLTRKKWSPPAK